MVLWIKPRVSCITGKPSTTELHPTPKENIVEEEAELGESGGAGILVSQQH